jgi:hypothetical protein
MVILGGVYVTLWGVWGRKGGGEEEELWVINIIKIITFVIKRGYGRRWITVGFILG